MNPKIAYQRRYYPIDANSSEEKLKQYNRLSFTYKEGWQQITLPCGECPACRLEHANEWATRCMLEAKTWNGKGIFVTLTYNNPHLPKNKNGMPTLRKKDIQNFKKRLRKYIAKHGEAISYWQNPKTGKFEKPIRTFECGEYGPTNSRPHYHQLIFNWIPNDLKLSKQKGKDGSPLYESKILQKIWGNGFVIIGMLSYESASYVARYTMKKQGLAKTKRIYYDTEEMDKKTGEFKLKTKYKTKKGEIEPEFITMSTAPGIGYAYYMEHQESIKENNGILINIKGQTKLKKIPRYFRKLMERIRWEDYERWKSRNKELNERLTKEKIEKFNLPKDMLQHQKEYWYYQKTLDNQKQRLGLMSHRNNINLSDDYYNEIA